MIVNFIYVIYIYILNIILDFMDTLIDLRLTVTLTKE